jgi:hypothetical protein
MAEKRMVSILGMAGDEKEIYVSTDSAKGEVV